MRSNFSTLKQLIQKVIQRLSMYNGTSVQVYAEDRIAQMILDNYQLVVDDFDWQGLTFTKKFTLSGLNGECIENVVDDIADFDDILSIIPEGDYASELHKLHDTTLASKVCGETPRYFEKNIDNDYKIFKIVPYDATGNIFVTAKGKLDVNNTTITPDDIIPFDTSYLVYAVCADYLADDDNSQTQYEKFSKLRESRLQQLKAIDNDGIIDLNNEVSYETVTEWR